MKKSIQQSFQQINWKHRYSHGGSLRKQREGRLARPLSTKEPLHLVFKANHDVIKGGFRQPRRFAMIHHLVQKYKFKFYVKVEQISIQGDHLHLLIRTTRRSNYHSFFRVVAGQIAQRFEKEGLVSVPKSVTDTPGSGNKKEARDRVTALARVETGSQALAELEVRVEARVRSKAGSEDKSFVEKQKPKLWLWRPFSRVVRGWRAYQTVRNYIQLNEREALGDIPYRKERLRGLSSVEWEILWS